MQTLYPNRDIRLLEGPGICKADNVWTGFRAAKGDVLMILDADLSVMPEELPVFFRTLVENAGEFVNGSRLVYPVPKTAMKFFNQAGNRVFGIVFSYFTEPAFQRHSVRHQGALAKRLAQDREWPGKRGIRDLWGDYELIFVASKLHLEIVECRSTRTWNEPTACRLK